MSVSVEERRRLPIFIHSVVDDMTDITPNAMRVYMHLARRAGKDGSAYPSHQSIGNHCFASVSDNAVTRRSMARKAIEELIQHRLIEKKARMTEQGDQDSNGYVLLDVGGGVPIDTGVPIGTGVSNKHTGVPNKHTGVPIGTKDTPLEGTPLEGLFTLADANVAQAPKPLTQQQEMFGALIDVCVLDAKMHGARVGKMAAQLLAAGYTAEQVKAFPCWWKKDWRGVKGATPTLQQVNELIKQSLHFANGNGSPIEDDPGGWNALGKENERVILERAAQNADMDIPF